MSPININVVFFIFILWVVSFVYLLTLSNFSVTSALCLTDDRTQAAGCEQQLTCELGSLSTLTNVGGGGERERAHVERQRESTCGERERAHVRGYVGEMMAVMTMETQPRERGRRPDIKTRTVEIGGAQQVPIRREHKDLHIGPGGQEAIV